MSLHPYQNPATTEPIRQRLSEMATNGNPATAKAGELLSRLAAPPPLSEATLTRIEAKLLTAAPTGAIAGSLLRWLGIGVTVAAVSGASYFVAAKALHRGHIEPQVLTAPATASRPVDSSSINGMPEAALAAAPEVDDEPAPASLRPSINPRSVRSRKAAVTVAQPVVSAAPATAPPPAEESELLAESQMLGQALHQLHQTHDATAALGSLSAYEARFPRGLLGEEAQAAKVDALLALSRRGEALSILDRVTFSRLARGGELRAVRGELRASDGRCREAVSDFAWALGHQPTTGTAERALYGRAACNQTLRDSEGARADYSDYLQRFPAGKFAPAAEAALRNLPEK